MSGPGEVRCYKEPKVFEHIHLFEGNTVENQWVQRKCRTPSPGYNHIVTFSGVELEAIVDRPLF